MEPNIVFSHVTKTYKGGVTALEDSVEAADLDGAGGGRLHGDEGFHQGGLARPVVAQQPKDCLLYTSRCV